jgi:hypothetical protein
MKSLALAACLSVLGSVASAQTDSFLCVGQLSTGFQWADNRWQVRQRGVEDEIFVVQPSSNGNDYSVTRIGTESPRHYCPPLRRRDGTLLLTCGGLGNGFAFSSRTLRFQENYGIGYTNGADSNANVPYLLIGKCAKLDLRGTIQ